MTHWWYKRLKVVTVDKKKAVVTISKKSLFGFRFLFQSKIQFLLDKLLITSNM